MATNDTLMVVGALGAVGVGYWWWHKRNNANAMQNSSTSSGTVEDIGTDTTDFPTLGMQSEPSNNGSSTQLYVNGVGQANNSYTSQGVVSYGQAVGLPYEG